MWKTGRLLVALMVAVHLASPISAHASPDPLAQGSTTLTFAPAFRHLLATHGVSLEAGPPAKLRGSALRLPLAFGSFDPTASDLALEDQGTLIFARGRRRVIFRHLNLKTAHTPLIAKVGGGQLKIATAAERHFTRQGFGAAFRATGLRLTAKVATRLSKKLGLPDVFEQGQLLGTARASVAPATLAVLPAGRISLTPDPAFLAKLDSLFVSLTPIAPAERAPGPLFTLPFIPAGTIAPDASIGVPRSGGSLEFLQLGAGQIFWHELWFDIASRQVLAEVDIEPTPTFPGKLGQLAILDLGLGTVSSDPKARKISVSAAPLSLTAASAAHFNQALAAGKETFHAGEALGTVSFSAQTQ